MNRENEFLKTQYIQLRETMREQTDAMKSRISRGIASIGLITAYAFYTEQFILFSAVPVLIGFLAILHLENFTWMMRIARQICIIQTIVDVYEFTWEGRHGMFGNNHWLHAVYGYSGALVIAIFMSFQYTGFQRYCTTSCVFGCLSRWIQCSSDHRLVLWIADTACCFVPHCHICHLEI